MLALLCKDHYLCLDGAQEAPGMAVASAWESARARQEGGTKGAVMTESSPWRERLLALCAPALLVLVAAVHLFLVEAEGAVSVEGGGFRDVLHGGLAQRALPSGVPGGGASEVQVRLPDRMKDLGYGVRVLPTHAALEGGLASRVASGTWVPERLASRRHSLSDGSSGRASSSRPEAPRWGASTSWACASCMHWSPAKGTPPLGRAHIPSRARGVMGVRFQAVLLATGRHPDGGGERECAP